MMHLLLTEIKEELIKSDPNCAANKAICEGDIKRYRVDYKDTYLILLQVGIRIEMQNEMAGITYQNLPSIANHLLNYKDQLIKRSDRENTGGNYALVLTMMNLKSRSCCYPIFQQEGILFWTLRMDTLW